MSWKKYSKSIVWYNIFKGLYTEEPIGDIPTNPKKGETYLAQANNVYAPGISAVLRKRPGFSKVRATAINANGIIAGMQHLGEIADEFILGVSISGTSHSLYRDSADPPGELATGTNFTIGQNNLLSSILFSDGTNAMAIFTSRQKDLPQSVNSSATRADFTIAGTGLTSLKPEICEVLGQRALYGDYDQDGTVYDDRVAWSAVRDGNLIDDITTDFESFETTEKDRIRAIRKFSDLGMVGKLNNVFLLAVTPAATKPFAVQEVPAGRYKGPVSHQATTEANQKAFWMGQTNIHSLDAMEQIKDWADVLRPTIAGLADDRREFSVVGHDVERNLLLFNVSDSGDTTNDLTIALNYKTGALYLWTLRRNAYAPRLVSGEHRLIGGGYVGLFYREMDGTSGDLDDATAVIDADVFTPRFWLNAYGHKQKIPFVLLSVDPIGSEKITVQYRLDDDSSWTTPDESPISVSGTDTFLAGISIGKWAERIQLRFRNNTADEVYSVKAVGVPGLPTQPILK